MAPKMLDERRWQRSRINEVSPLVGKRSYLHIGIPELAWIECEHCGVLAGQAQCRP